MSQALHYRPDVDGLRAVAITMVVGYHVGFPQISGGFAGVDVFFVISGFLITQILVRELQATGKISILDFYARRIRRLLPALALVLSATLMLGAVLLLPTGEQQELGRSTVAAAGFVSNLYFGANQLNYFATPTQFLPLLHTWSLAIEEQYYLVWPIALIAINGWARRTGKPLKPAIFTVVTIGAFTSLTLFVSIGVPRPNWAFYLPPFRAWEPAIGGLLALASLDRVNPKVARTLGYAGLAAILAAGLFFHENTPFAGAAAIVASFGAVAVVAAGSVDQRNAVYRILASSVAVAIGRWSYGWYLWHWPLLALSRSYTLGQSPWWLSLMIALVALALAMLTWRFVEQPIRLKRLRAFRTVRATIVSGIILTVGCAIGGAALVAWGDHGAQRTPLMVKTAAAKASLNLLKPACNGAENGFVTPPRPEECVLGQAGGSDMVLVWGDSHARDISQPLAYAAKSNGIALLPRVRSGCRPTVKGPQALLASYRTRACAKFNTFVFGELKNLKRSQNLKGVILTARWSQDDAEVSLPQLVEQLRGLGLRVVIASETPTFPYDVPNCLARRGEQACDLSRGLADRPPGRLQALLRSGDTAMWSPLDTLCAANVCPATSGGEILYRDSNHLTKAGASSLTQAIAQPLTWAAGRHVQMSRTPRLSPTQADSNNRSDPVEDD